MPLVASPYRAPLALRNGHVHTVAVALRRRVPEVAFAREAFETADGERLALDWMRGGHRRLAILTHGLEGSTRGAYVRGMARALSAAGWDVLAWNNRGCGDLPARGLLTYHSGFTDDLAALVETARTAYPTLGLVGFSMGGNVTLKYLGERSDRVPPEVRAAVVFSVPVDLASSARRLAEPANRLYMRRFLRSLRRQLEGRAARHPGAVSLDGFARVRTFADYDARYTAPLHGFDGAEGYWAAASARPLLPAVRVPTLLVNALDDPFLAPPCFPMREAEANPCLWLEAPRDGGHCGFYAPGPTYYSEARAAAFLARHAA